MRKAILMLAVTLVATGPGCRKKSAAARAEDQARARAAEIDARCVKLLGEPGASEARAWLAPEQTSHMGFEVGTTEMLRITEDLYRDGARQVWVAGISQVADKEVAAILIAELPDDPDRRLAVLDRAEAVLHDEDGDGAAEQGPRDVGQRYVFLALD